MSVWDATAAFPLVPSLVKRNSDGFVLLMQPGYYSLFVHTARCLADPYFGVLAGRDRRLDVSMRCKDVRSRKSYGIRLVDAARGLAGTLPGSVRSISMRAAGDGKAEVLGTISRGAYYVDEVNCGDCVLFLALANGKHARIAATPRNAKNFTLVRNDISDDAVRRGTAVRGSPFNAPEQLVEGPSGSIWILDPLGNRVAVIESGHRCHEYDLPTPFADAGDIVATAQSVWVSERSVGKIVRFRLDGSRVEYPADTSGDNQLSKMILGGDGRVWYIDGDQLGAMSESGAASTFGFPAPLFWVKDIVLGSDQRIWIAGMGSSQGEGSPFIASLDETGHWQRFPITRNPEAVRASRNGFWVAGRYDTLSFVDFQGRETPVGLPISYMEPKLFAVDDTDTLWFSDRYGNVIAHAKPNGSAAATYTDFGPAGISDMRVDASGGVWVAESKAHVIEQYKKGFALPPAGVYPKNLLFDSKGNLWYSDPVADVVGVIAKDGTSRCYAFPLSHVRHCSFQRAELLSDSLP